QALAMRQAERVLHEARDPGAGGIDEAAGPDRPALPRRKILDDGGPGWSLAARGDAARAGQDLRPALLRVEGVQRHQPRIIDAAIGIAEALGQGGLEGLAGGIAPEVEPARARQQLAPAQVVVEE